MNYEVQNVMAKKHLNQIPDLTTLRFQIIYVYYMYSIENFGGLASLEGDEIMI